MDQRGRFGLLALVLIQAAHSAEEHHFRLYDRLAPARAISDLASSDRATGFLIVNTALVAFGFVCWLVLKNAPKALASAILWGWTLAELANGLVHLVLAGLSGGYFPGAGTAPLLVLCSALNLLLLIRPSSKPDH